MFLKTALFSVLSTHVSTRQMAPSLATLVPLPLTHSVKTNFKQIAIFHFWETAMPLLNPL